MAAIVSGAHVLVTAPTEAANAGGLSMGSTGWSREPGAPADQVLYISPLRARNNDIRGIS